MSRGFRIIVETFDLETNIVDTTTEIQTLKLTAPAHIDAVGFNHIEQINILQQVLDNLIVNQCVLIDEHEKCPECGSVTKKAGKIASHFHSVFTDHKVKMARRLCRCGWSNKPTIEGKFGISSHPDLLKMQCELGSEHSYAKAEEILLKKNARKRKVNNHMRLSRNVDTVGKIISNLKCGEPTTKVPAAQKVVVQVDGGHICAKDQEKRSLEVLISKAYNPENLVKIDKHHARLNKRTCVGSALADKNITIKKQVVYAAKSEGMNSDTTVYGIADGAKNCWKALSELKKHCKELITILDWCHISRKFKNVEQQLPEKVHEQLDKAKCCLWHGQDARSLEKLYEIKKGLLPEDKAERLMKLCSYIKENQKNIINYNAYKEQGLPFTSSIIESAVDTIINDRQARTKKMQWTRDGAHNVVQIKSSRASNSWDADWQQALRILIAA